MVSDDRERQSGPFADFPQNEAELDVILQLRAFVRAAERAQNPTADYNRSNLFEYGGSPTLSQAEIYVLYKLRHGFSIESELVKSSLYELMTNFEGRVSREDRSDNRDIESGAVMSVDFATAAALCVIEAVEQSRPSQPISAEERNKAMEGTHALRRMAREARADL